MSLDPELADRVLTLPLTERVELLRRLTESIESEGVDAEVEACWDAEIRDRLDRYDRGETDATDAFEALEEIRQSLRRDRGQ